MCSYSLDLTNNGLLLAKFPTKKMVLPHQHHLSIPNLPPSLRHFSYPLGGFCLVLTTIPLSFFFVCTPHKLNVPICLGHHSKTMSYIFQIWGHPCNLQVKHTSPLLNPFSTSDTVIKRISTFKWKWQANYQNQKPKNHLL